MSPKIDTVPEAAVPKPMETQDTRMVNTLNTFISNESCVLLLGPLFGIDRDGKKVHTQLKNRLKDPANNFDLDDEFDNLYISKRPDGSQNADLITEICSFYENIKGSDIYDKILKIGFRAVITYTADLFLYDANVDNKYDFSFFSIKGNQPMGDAGRNGSISSKPVIYNIFGNVGDLNSLITDYDSLYDFLIGLMKADQEIPLQLRNILSNAKAFLFLGFDLSKWYIPLLVRKLNQFILNGNRAKASVSAFACMDDTPYVPAQPLPYNLNKYPLLFKPFQQKNAVELVDELYKMPRKEKGEVKGPPPLTPPERAFFEKWNQEIKNYGYEEGLSTFFQEYKKLNYSGNYKNELNILNIDYNEHLTQKISFRMKEEDFRVDCNKMIDSVCTFITKLLV